MSQLALIDINLLRDFRYILTDSICAKALDMLPHGNEIYITSKTSIASLYRILRSKIYRTRKACISTKEKEKKNSLREETIDFAIEISDVCDNIKGCSVYINQLLRASSSIGANLHEAKYAQSTADFINKLEVSLKESYETEYWLELLFRKNKIDEITYKNLTNKCGTIRRKLIASVTTVKNRNK